MCFSTMATGQYSDDSQMARELMQCRCIMVQHAHRHNRHHSHRPHTYMHTAYVECGKFDPAVYASRLATLVKESRAMGCGLATGLCLRCICVCMHLACLCVCVLCGVWRVVCTVWCVCVRVRVGRARYVHMGSLQRVQSMHVVQSLVYVVCVRECKYLQIGSNNSKKR